MLDFRVDSGGGREESRLEMSGNEGKERRPDLARCSKIIRTIISTLNSKIKTHSNSPCASSSGLDGLMMVTPAGVLWRLDCTTIGAPVG